MFVCTGPPANQAFVQRAQQRRQRKIGDPSATSPDSDVACILSDDDLSPQRSQPNLYPAVYNGD